jgi:hypothetical protein
MDDIVKLSNTEVFYKSKGILLVGVKEFLPSGVSELCAG